MTNTKRNIPKFQVCWSEQMDEFLGSKNDAFIEEHIIEICESWGCKEKSSRVKDVLENVVRSPIVFAACMVEVKEWATCNW